MQKLVLRLTLAVVLMAWAVTPVRLAASAPSQIPTSYVANGWPTDQIILQYAPGAAHAGPALAGQMQVLSAAAGTPLSYFREMSGEAHVLKLPARLPAADVQAIADRLSKLPGVAYAEPDRIMRPALIPNDPQYVNQWHYVAPGAGNYGANLPAAWDVVTGTANIRVAVLDTGILFTHPDLIGRTVPGYDFISDVPTANDGGGRDADAADPGDWAEADVCFPGSNPLDSSWHGTHVAGTIGAASNNGQGVTGINWVSPIQPVRVLGSCGGATSDIADAIRWAAGLSVVGVPNNATPARVINLSLGGPGACGATFQNAINAAIGAGAVIVIAAGNSNVDAAFVSPANCSNVVTVAASDRDGQRAFYSNFGSVVEIAAPGGETNVQDADGVLSTLNLGTTVPLTHTYIAYQGTSMAAPHVAGVASLMLSANPTLSPAQVSSLLQASVTPFPGGSSCTTSTCGAGIVNAAAAVQAALTSNTVYLPYLSRALPSWTNIVTEGFEGVFPTGLWQVSDPGYEEYFWAARNCRAHTGSRSAWAIGGGSFGSGLGCGSEYPTLMNSWMVYGPFSLVGATDAELNYQVWQNSELDYDEFCAMASLDANWFYGPCYTGSTGGNWFAESLDLTNVDSLGDLRGQPNVWIAFRFFSDDSINYAEGAYIDQVVLRMCPAGGVCAASSASAEAAASGLVSAPAAHALDAVVNRDGRD